MISREGGGGIAPIDWRERNWWEIPNFPENKFESASPRHVCFLVDKEQPGLLAVLICWTRFNFVVARNDLPLAFSMKH